MRRTLEKFEQPPPPPAPGPDAGLAAIAAGYIGTVGQAPREQEAPSEHGAGPHLVSPRDVWPLDLPPQSATAATNFDPVDWGPPTGWAWRIRSVYITMSGASQAQVYREAVFPVQLRFSTTASGTWEPSWQLLTPGKRLIVVFTGGGGTVAIDGERIRLRFLPTYMA